MLYLAAGPYSGRRHDAHPAGAVDLQFDQEADETLMSNALLAVLCGRLAVRLLRYCLDYLNFETEADRFSWDFEKRERP